MATLQTAYSNGDFQKDMLEMDAFSKVTGVNLMGELHINKANADAGTPTQLTGTCQLSGIPLSGFQTAQREAFKSVMAASSGATKDQVVITNVLAMSSRRRLRGDGGEVSGVRVEFAIVVARESVATEKPSENAKQPEGLSAGVVAAIAICSVLAVLLAAGVTMITLRKCFKKNSQVASMQSYTPTQRSKHGSKFNGKQDKQNEIELTNKPCKHIVVRKFSDETMRDEHIPLV